MILSSKIDRASVHTDKQTASRYHTASGIVIGFYFMIGLRPESLWAVLSVVSVSALSLYAVDIFSGARRPNWIGGISILKNQQRQIDFDLTLYIFIATVVSVFEIYFLNYPSAATARTFIAILSAGVYASLGIALDLEYDCIRNNVPVNITRITQIVPGKVKLRQFLTLIFAAGLLNFALALLDFSVQNFARDTSLAYQAEQSFQELVFVAGAVLGASIYLIYLYNRNLFHILGTQVNILQRVEAGSFETSMPVVSEDESGLLANYHNIMIERLRDRERLYSTLKKSVGPNIMAKLLYTDEQTLKHGQAYCVAILFCDLRGFSSLGESASAEEIILFLNAYFAEVSSIISEHEGIINKFMGDAVLAIFGLDGKEGAVEQAVVAGLEIIERSASIYMPNAMHPETGVGIHYGTVAAGTIGSEERYEYTVVGDAVNKASRLESLSKRLEFSLILSKDAYLHLKDTMRNEFIDLGAHMVRGRSEPIHVYGAKKKSAPH
jgi:class 3 adenylate cyclase